VDVAFKADQSSADSVAAQLRSDGYEPIVQEISERAPDDPQSGPVGYLVRTGAFARQAEANALRDRLAADGYTGLRVVYTGEDGTETTGPWVVHVLEIDPARYDGTLRPELATQIIPDKETITSISARTDALAATNGGYFVVDPTDGTPGDLAGISVLRGQLASEAVDGRTSLLLPASSGEGADIAALTDTLSATASEGARREVDGVNRAPGLIRTCGDVGGDQPTERPKHGTEPDGKLLLVAVDGHAPGYSVGASCKEEAAVMASLGAKKAVNLDGGGSTTMTVGGDLVNRPSDATGERPVGDAVVLLP
jgi:hypothetical protein